MIDFNRLSIFNECTAMCFMITIQYSLFDSFGPGIFFI